MLLADFATITNLHPLIHNKIVDDRRAITHAVTHCSLLLFRSDALTPSIIQWVWGANGTIQRTLGRPRGDLALIR